MKLSSSRANYLRRIGRAAKGDPTRSMFYGDPVEVAEEQPVEAVTSPSAAEEAAVSAAATGADQVAADRLVNYENMSTASREEVTEIWPLTLANASIIQRPVKAPMLTSNVNYVCRKTFIDYAQSGKIAYGERVSAGHAVVKFNGDTYDGAKGSVPFLRFNISASTLNARPGANYRIWATGVLENGTAFTTKVYTFQRIDATQAITGFFFPFQVIDSRTLPAMGVFGGSTSPVEFQLHIDGVADDSSSLIESVTATHPGYSTMETEVACELFSLSACKIN